MELVVLFLYLLCKVLFFLFVFIDILILFVYSIKKTRNKPLMLIFVVIESLEFVVECEVVVFVSV